MPKYNITNTTKPKNKTTMPTTQKAKAIKKHVIQSGDDTR